MTHGLMPMAAKCARHCVRKSTATMGHGPFEKVKPDDEEAAAVSESAGLKRP
jgi:hypothetical protein